MAPGKKREIAPEAKMARVLRVARQLFVEKGYYNVSIPLIVKASGVSTGAIYSYFANKEDLARRIHAETLQDFQQMLDARLRDAQTTREKLEAFARLCFDVAESDPVMMEYMLYMKHAEFMTDTTPICFTEPFRLVRGILVQGMDRGDIRRQDVYVAAISYTGVILRAIQLRLLCVVNTPLQEIADELMANAWAAIANHSTAN
ncbi:MAG: TetR/AcrR family transcriptional regulator [Desulfuromonas sp.]|jgi:AcrR family transcriptional regulator|nr:TetR/AcrR family transcriptional regulator [Desulfuromonas thiophila]